MKYVYKYYIEVSIKTIDVFQSTRTMELGPTDVIFQIQSIDLIFTYNL